MLTALDHEEGTARQASSLSPVRALGEKNNTLPGAAPRMGARVQ